MYKQIIITLVTVVFNLGSVIILAQSYQTDTAKNSFKWPEGKKMALSLTFDDARFSQPDKGIPVLDKYGVKGTFYLIPDAMLKRLEGWKKAVSNGHEIGNHSLTHPCTGNFDWSRDNALENFTVDAITGNLDSANKIIKRELGVLPVSFAFPCGQKFIGRGTNTKSYVPVVARMFETGRGWLDEAPNEPSYCDMAQITGMELDGKSFEEAKKIIESAKKTGKWLVFAGHEMDEGGDQTSLLVTIEAICRYAMDPANEIWIDNVHTIAAYIKQKRIELSSQPSSSRQKGVETLKPGY